MLTNKVNIVPPRIIRGNLPIFIITESKNVRSNNIVPMLRMLKRKMAMNTIKRSRSIWGRPQIPFFRLVNKLDCLFFMRLDVLCAMPRIKTKAKMLPAIL